MTVKTFFQKNEKKLKKKLKVADFVLYLHVKNYKLNKIYKMNKAELVNVMAEKAGLTKVDAKKALDAFICAATDAIRKGERISLVGFGTLSTTKRPARKGRNPQSGAEIMIAAKTVVKFKASADLVK